MTAAKTRSETAHQFGSNLRYCRRRSGVSQEELGYRASLHRTEISLLERGERTPRIDTLVKLAHSLDVPPEELLDGIEWSPGRAVAGNWAVSAENGD
jgi:transcriptional regulator with XRE-family HTH domain